MAIKDKTVESTKGHGFGGNPQSRHQSDSSEGVNQALALAGGLESTLLQQAQSLADLATKTDLAAEAIAAPLADFVGQVTSGELIMAKVAQKLEGKGIQPLNTDVSVAPPSLPQVNSSKKVTNFFGTPTRVSLPEA